MIFLTVTIIRCAVLYVFVTLAIRLMGKRQIGDLQPSELVITLLISEIAAIPLQDPSQPVLTGIVAIFTLVVLEIFVSVATIKSLRMRTLISGKAVVIIKNGVLDQKAMKSVRMTVLDLIELLRQNDVFDITEVAYAVLEVNGSLSVLLKSQYETVTRNDMKVPSKPDGLLLPVVCDGVVIEESLQAVGADQNTLDKILSDRRLTLQQVFILMLDRNLEVQLVKKEENR